MLVSQEEKFWYEQLHGDPLTSVLACSGFQCVDSIVAKWERYSLCGCQEKNFGWRGDYDFHCTVLATRHIQNTRIPVISGSSCSGCIVAALNDQTFLLVWSIKLHSALWDMALLTLNFILQFKSFILGG